MKKSQKKYKNRPLSENMLLINALLDFLMERKHGLIRRHGLLDYNPEREMPDLDERKELRKLLREKRPALLPHLHVYLYRLRKLQEKRPRPNYAWQPTPGVLKTIREKEKDSNLSYRMAAFIRSQGGEATQREIRRHFGLTLKDLKRISIFFGHHYIITRKKGKSLIYHFLSG